VTTIHEPEFQLWLGWEHFESCDNDEPDDDFVNMKVRLPDGCCYSLTVWTYRTLERAHQTDVKTGTHLGGSYLFPPDLCVAQRGHSLFEAVVRDILRTGVPERWRLEVAEDVE
jgi:hypothetical protein